jgi:hypothetical protein
MGRVKALARGAFLIGVCICLVGVISSLPAEGDGSMARTVASCELMTRIRIIGLMGHPLGEMISIEGVWYSRPRSKDGNARFRVMRINGVQLKRPVDFGPGLVSPLDRQGYGPNRILEHLKEIEPEIGDVWELRGFETGAVRGLSGQALKELGLAVQQPYSNAFVTEFRYVRATLVRRTGTDTTK